MDQLLSDLPTSVGVQTREEGRALLEKARVAIASARYEVVPVHRIRPMTNQPRKFFNPDRLQKLKSSITQIGQLMPGYLRVVPGGEGGHDFELVDGERRWRAIVLANIPTYRAMIVDIDDEAAQYLVSAIANFNREGHTVLEIVDSIVNMHEQLKLTIQEIADSIGFHPIYATNLYGLRRLTIEVRDMLDPELVPKGKKVLPPAAAIEISRLPQDLQAPLARRVRDGKVSVRSLRGEIEALSTQEGLTTRGRMSDPHSQRRAIERRISQARSECREVRELLETAPPAIIRGWVARVSYRTEITLAQEDLAAALAAMDQVK